MRVYCLTSSFPRHRGDASGRFVAEWCRLLVEAGHDVTVFYWGRGPHDASVGVDARSVPYLPGAIPHVFDGSGAPDALAGEPWRALEGPLALGAMLAAVLREPTPDLWVGHWLLPGGLAARVCGSLSARPSLVVGHSAGVHMVRRMPTALRDVVEPYLLAGPTTVPSRALAAYLRWPVEVLPMGFHPIGDRGAREGARRVLLYGRLEAIKGFDLVAPFLGEREVHVAGDGSLRGSLENALPNATFHGFVDEPSKRALFPTCDVACFPSRVLGDGRHEGWPVSVLEAASAGVIPLVADWPGSDELVVRPELQVVGRGEWGNRLQTLEESDDASREELRQETKKRALEFTWDALRERWLEMIR